MEYQISLPHHIIAVIVGRIQICIPLMVRKHPTPTAADIMVRRIQANITTGIMAQETLIRTSIITALPFLRQIRRKDIIATLTHTVHSRLLRHTPIGIQMPLISIPLKI